MRRGKWSRRRPLAAVCPSSDLTILIWNGRCEITRRWTATFDLCQTQNDTWRVFISSRVAPLSLPYSCRTEQPTFWYPRTPHNRPRWFIHDWLSLATRVCRRDLPDSVAPEEGSKPPPICLAEDWWTFNRACAINFSGPRVLVCEGARERCPAATATCLLCQFPFSFHGFFFEIFIENMEELAL